MLNKLLESQVSSKSLGLFRIVYSVVLFLEVWRMNFFQHLIYDIIPYFERNELLFGPILILWLCVIPFLIVGFKTRIAAILNYVIGFFLIGTIHGYEYHMFYSYMIINFFMIFSPVSKSYSIDSLIEKINKSSVKMEYKSDEKISEFYYYMFVFFGIAVVYLDSTSFKLVSRMWLDGLGMWLPASVPFAVNVNLTSILNQEVVMKVLGYLTLVFELVFILVFWVKRLKYLFFIIGVGLHIGIYVLFPIPQFAEGVIGLYLLMLPFNYPEKFNFLKSKKQLEVFYNSSSALCVRKKIIIEFFDFFGRLKFTPIADEEIVESNLGFYLIISGTTKKDVDAIIDMRKQTIYLYPFGLLLQVPFIKNRKARSLSLAINNKLEYVGFQYEELDENKYYFSTNLTVTKFKTRALLGVFYFLLVLQIIVTVRSPFVYNYFSRYTIYTRFIGETKPITKFSKFLFGITNHGVFTDSHFIRYNHLFKVEYIDKQGRKILLPIMTEEGMPGEYLKSFVWAKWTFRVDGTEIKQQRLENGIRDFTAFWLNNSNLISDPKKEHNFVISCKRIDYTMKYENDFLNKQIAKPWIEIGTANWRAGKFAINISDAEKVGLK